MRDWRPYWAIFRSARRLNERAPAEASAERRACTKSATQCRRRECHVRGERRNNGWPRTLQEKVPMKKYLIASVLVVSLTAPAMAVETFYIMFDNSMKGQPGACKVMTSKPSDAKYKSMGEYKSQAEADAAMKTMKECG